MLAGLLASVVPESATAQADYGQPRAAMVAEIARMARETGSETGRPAFSEPVMGAIGKVPRHRFVPPEQLPHAYENRPLPIGLGQTISQPYIVALMTDLLDLKPTDTVLEIGTGSGYQAAVLAEIAAQVYTIEIVEAVGKAGAAALVAAGYRRVVTRIGDGYHGWKEHAPFDAIIVTAAPPTVPAALLEQLKPGGRMVIPVGGRFDVQELMVITKRDDGSSSQRRTIPVRFVPLTRTP